MTDTAPLTHAIPRHILCVVGTGLRPGTVEERLAAAGLSGFTADREYSAGEPDPRMPAAFRASSIGRAFTDEDRLAVDTHDSVVYVFSPPAIGDSAPDISARTLAAAAVLLADAGTALKNESCGLAHGRDTWLDLAEAAEEADDDAELAAVLYRAWVARPINDDGLLYSCGMHLLGEPDVELEADDHHDPERLREYALTLDAFALYLLTEGPELADGQGFRRAVGAPRWEITETPCRRYGIMDDPYYNPYGYWRLSPG